MPHSVDSYLDCKAIGELARKLRIQSNLSQLEIAQKIGSSQPNISAAERGNDTRYITVAINVIQLLSKKTIVGPYYFVVEQNDDDE